MKKKIVIAVLLLITIIGLPVVYAKEMDDTFYASEKVEIKGEKDHTIFAAGKDVTVNSTVDGMVFAAGYDVNVKGTQDYVFAAGETVDIENAGSKELFAAGANVNIKNSELRDTFVSANRVTVESSKMRNAYIAGEKVVIDSTIEGNLKVNASRIIIAENAVVTGTLEYPESASIDISKEATISKTKSYAYPTKSKTKKTTDVTDLFFSGISMVIISLLLLLINKSVYKKIEEYDKGASKIVTTMLIGTAFLIVIPIIILVLFMTGIGVSLGLLLLICYGVLFYLSVIPTAYYIGKWIMKDKINDYSILAISVLCAYIIRMLPVVGKIFCFASLIFGLGVYTNLIYGMISKENKKEVTLKEKTDK